MLAVVDYGMGNVASVRNAFDYLGMKTALTSDFQVMDSCSAIVLPGVGAFGAAMDELLKKGLAPYLRRREEEGAYILGICLGLQLFLEKSEEDPGSAGIGFFTGEVVRFPGSVKVPHMGWNRVYFKADKLFKGIPNGSYFYFAHSYYASLANDDGELAGSRYGVKFTAAVKKGRVYGLQFHPEKSGTIGLQILGNFGRMVYDADHSGY